MNRLEFLNLLNNVNKTFKNIDSETSCEFGITPTEFEIITLIAECENCKTAKEIERVADLKAHTIAVNIDKLVSEGYITAGHERGNRQKVIFTLTKKAKPIVQRGREINEQVMKYLYDRLTPDEIATMEKGLAVVNYNAMRLS